MSNNINRAEGGGPWRLELDDPLAPGEWTQFDLERMTYRGQKGYFVPWLPMDQVMIKNLHSSSGVDVTYNGQFGAVVEANAADVFDDVRVRKIELENIGGTEIPVDELVIQVSVEPFGADDAARREQQRSPLERIARNTLGL